jgi:hypothetical protein
LDSSIDFQMAWGLLRGLTRTNTEERRSEERAKANASVVITPLASVAIRFEGSVVDVSTRGVRVHVETQLQELPRTGDVYRVQSGDDIMLCEVRHAEVAGAGADLGLLILHWSKEGKLKRLIEHQKKEDQKHHEVNASRRLAVSFTGIEELATWFALPRLFPGSTASG